MGSWYVVGNREFRNSLRRISKMAEKTLTLAGGIQRATLAKVIAAQQNYGKGAPVLLLISGADGAVSDQQSDTFSELTGPAGKRGRKGVRSSH